MKNWTKIPVTKQQIDPLTENFNIDQILASIFVRRGITTGNDILYYLENDIRFQHSPFCFSNMEDAVERILQAKEEGEKVLIFGDRDADGITSTTILYNYLKNIGVNVVEPKVPVFEDAYGLSIQAIDDFYAEEGTLIITVDCGISNYIEINHANDLGIDVIVTDHHNAPDELPAAIVILDPKTEDSNYPFIDISGAAVAYKLVSALRFAHSDFYNAEICFMNITANEEEKCFYVDCVKIRNLVKEKELHEKIIPGKTSIYDLKLPVFLSGQIIYVWDAKESTALLQSIFGTGIQFNLNDFRNQISQVKSLAAIKNKSVNEIKNLSLIGKYIPEERTVINALYNLYVTYCKAVIAEKKPEQQKEERKDLQLVALAAIADIMPLKNENRIFLKAGIESMKKDGLRPGLAELFARLRINKETITATSLSWTVTPALNAAGRLGQADLTLKLLISDDPKERDILANRIYELNEERKDKVNNASFKVHEAAEKSIQQLNNKLCVVIDEDIHPGITGNFAGRLMQDFNVPAIVVTSSEDIYKGSMRSCRGLITTDFLSGFGDFFINYGGHDAAAGFSFEKSKFEIFLKKVEDSLSTFELESENQDIYIDAEIPEKFLTPKTFDLLDKMEPFGHENPEILLMTQNLKICDAIVQGKKEPYSLKLVFECGPYKFPAIYFGQAERFNKDIFVGENYDILYTLNRNYFNGTVTPQLRIKEIRKSN